MAKPVARRYSIAEAKDRLSSVVRDVERGTAAEITRRGKAVAVLVPLADYQALKGRHRGFWAACERFRAAHDVAGLRIGASVFRGVRDRSPGREPTW
jgi:prevent-host-death family protein